MNNTPPSNDSSAEAHAQGSADVVHYATPAPQRGLRDYVIILRERLWYILIVFLLIVSAAVIYTVRQTKIYQAVASVQILRSDPTVMTKVQAVLDNNIRSAEDLNTLVKILESATIIQKVADRLTGEDQKQFMAPYTTGEGSDPLTPAEILAKNRKIIPVRVSLIIGVQYRHPDRFIAAKIANMFVDEFIAYNARVRIAESMKAVDELKSRVDQQRRKVEQLSIDLQAYRESHNLVSLDQRKDITTETLKGQNILLTQTSARLKDAEVRWKQVQELRAAGGDLTQLSFIAIQPIITQLLQKRAAQNIELSQLRERYRDKHPKLIEARKSHAQIDAELAIAIHSASAIIEGDYQTALRSTEAAKSALLAQESASLATDRAGVNYKALYDQLSVEDAQMQSLMVRMRETSLSSTMETQNARVIDYALVSQPEDFVKPSFLINIGAGVVGGLGAGVLLALVIALIDDRVKSSFDIEAVVGLPLVGVVPRLDKMSDQEKAVIACSGADPQVAEAFLSIHSALRLNDQSRRAKCLLVTSTIPGEGKSFTATNLALTFAAHGEKVVLVDCDLRKPNIHRSLALPNESGVIDLCGGTRLDSCVHRAFRPNLDVITTGGRSKTPTQLLGSDGFARLLTELREKYDRVIIDTPPLAAVSDALVVLPLTDGSLYNLFFNKVRRRAAQHAVRRLLESGRPTFGAILNGLEQSSAAYYYSEYSDKAYKSYYVGHDQPGSAASGDRLR